MQAAGGVLVKHYRELAFMGFVEVIAHLPEILHNLKFCKQDILDFAPDVLVLIDYPGFNLRIAQWAKPMGLKVAYYISPQVWAWKENRVKQIKASVDKMLVILPFEVDFYKKWDFPVQYVGHPLIETIDEEIVVHPIVPLSDKPIVALLPGSRAQEIRVKLPIMLQVVKHFPDYAFMVAQAPSQPEALYREVAGEVPMQLVKDQTYNLLRQARAALVTSGTATLETALLRTPEVVCYKGNAISFWLATKLVKVKYISLVNLIADKEVVKELIQNDLNEANLVRELGLLLNDKAHLSRLQADYEEIRESLGLVQASATAAEAILELAVRRN
jgi:lipid-A-disaccharide synthase